MAQLIQAITAYRPRVRPNRRVDLDELAARLARGSLVTPGLARLVVTELADELRAQLRTGARVHLPGIGRFRPEIRLDGTMRTVVRLDRRLRRLGAGDAGVSIAAGATGGGGLDVAALKARWDADHPDDPLEIPRGLARERMVDAQVAQARGRATAPQARAMPEPLPTPGSAAAGDANSR